MKTTHRVRLIDKRNKLNGMKPSKAWHYSSRTGTWLLDLEHWKVTVFEEKKGWRYIFSNGWSDFVYKNKEEAMLAAENEVILIYEDIGEKLEDIGVI